MDFTNPLKIISLNFICSSVFHFNMQFFTEISLHKHFTIKNKLLHYSELWLLLFSSSAIVAVNSEVAKLMDLEKKLIIL